MSTDTRVAGIEATLEAAEHRNDQLKKQLAAYREREKRGLKYERELEREVESLRSQLVQADRTPE